MCQGLGVPGNLSTIQPTGKLPFEDGMFDCVMAYSVFTHLPEPINLHWFSEISRVCRRGAVFCLTLEPRRFLEFVRDETPKGSSDWHRGLSHYSARANDLLVEFDRGNFVYLPTGGGDFRPESTYGDAVVPLSWIRKHWEADWTVRAYIDDRFWQAVLVMQKR
jgi:SAM-dependent methyltransferase